MGIGKNNSLFILAYPYYFAIMKSVLLNRKKSTILLSVYLFIMVAGSFHHHLYNFEIGGNSRIIFSNENKIADDFFDPSTGICSFEHFSQSVNYFDLNPFQISFILPTVKRAIEKDSLPTFHSFSHHFSAFRAPPAI